MKVRDGKIHLPARRVRANPQGVVKITPEAIELLADLANETQLSMRFLASEIIKQAIDGGLLSFDEPKMEDADDE